MVFSGDYDVLRIRILGFSEGTRGVTPGRMSVVEGCKKGSVGSGEGGEALI